MKVLRIIPLLLILAVSVPVVYGDSFDLNATRVDNKFHINGTITNDSEAKDSILYLRILNLDRIEYSTGWNQSIYLQAGVNEIDMTLCCLPTNDDYDEPVLQLDGDFPAHFNEVNITPPVEEQILDGIISVHGTSDTIQYEITGGRLYSAIPDNDFNSLILHIQMDTNGLLTLTIPRDVLDSQFSNIDLEFIVLVDGDEPTFTETQTTFQSRTLSIELSAGSEEIEIVGTSVGYQGSVGNVQPFSVTTNKSIYQHGDIITIYGSIKDLGFIGASVTIVVVDPEGDITTIAQVRPDDDGTFSTTLKAGGSMDVSGMYEVRAQYGALKITSSFIFTADGSVTTPDLEPTPEPQLHGDPEPTYEQIQSAIDSITNNNSKCGAGTVFDYPSNSCVLESYQPVPEDKTIADLKDQILALKLENRELKQQITKLQNDIEQLENLLINGLKEIYNWMS